MKQITRSWFGINQIPRWLFYIALVGLLLLAVSRSALRNVSSFQFVQGYWSQERVTTWLRAEHFQRRVLDFQEGSIDESIRLARVIVALGRTEEAISLWKSIGQPFAPFLLLDIGNSLWGRGEKARALIYWQKVPDLDIYFGLQGNNHLREGDALAALNDYQIGWMINDRALSLKGNALLSFCELLRQRGEITQAITTCERARESGNTFWSNIYLGILYSDRRDFMTAETYFRQAWAENPSHARANLWVGLSLANQGKWSEAMQFYRHGLVLSPDDGWLNYLMGKALWESGQKNDAQAYLEKSVLFVPDSWEAAYLKDALGLLSQLQP